MASFINWLNSLWARVHSLLGKLTRFVFYVSLALLGWYYISSPHILSTPTDNIRLGQIFSILLGAGILIITLIAFFDFPEEANTLADYSVYRSVWGNLGTFVIIVGILIYWWLSFNNHFDRPYFERVIILFTDAWSWITAYLNNIFK